MKILFLNGYTNDRGAETFVKELSTKLSRNNSVDVIIGNKKMPIRWPFLWRFFIDPHGIYTFWFTFKYLVKIWKEKYDVIIPINGGWQPALVRIITWLYRGKMVISGQSGMGWDDRNNLWCFPDYFVALSTHAKNWAKKVNPFVKVEYIPNGADLKKFKPDGKRYKTAFIKPIVLCVGALEQAKRIDLVIEAVAKLKGASLLIVGDGELREDIRILGNKRLGGRFKVIKLPFPRMAEVYRCADVFTLPSKSHQSFEIVLVEAMATNLPVVANNDPIRKEIVGDGGILVNPEDVGKYSTALKKALGIDWLNKPRTQAKRFDWDTITSSYEEIFEKLY
ncbi:hypothetical protein A3D00_05075 [Candidatus Woesebacteria bacterium RIFCSPHIGHO2_02_FULL_38_9]|uniref:Glycosyl transferase family 1 domain-containing protein n=1 Tax=Candidatus Woesebacteria bacterium RIFCSPHIGHO2_01_FULL_39_28 TaxID=1802496 RepID=A0A1F7YEF3_9BACT|nr:MAG: hypothetical protein A2627_02860 [Candidatus Woesebacteria bacterium RIFCSPHIGHO2_01_FULL_39_28]OGM32358.1 MAG: hypothetical protein A3D00_05075 [Candidatus Woesebacteria bacterium RIFCSPHIGHO2_02_FULL_38_9]OGM57989.1 MAG: hypothetical protein A3A50_01870 [Candidatus Woesebacteria bacterium RIFCSPLOWO2_01_FULL_38_20]